MKVAHLGVQHLLSKSNVKRSEPTTNKHSAAVIIQVKCATAYDPKRRNR